MIVAEIRIQNLHKSFAQFTAVRDSSMTIANGQFFVLLGPSGCGKTTTLRMIAGLEIPTSGQILLDGEEVTRLRAAQRDIAFVFQFFALYPHMNVSENLGFPLRTQGTPRAEIRRRVEEIAKLLRIDHLLGLPVSGLAGGDRQRVALGRAIIRRPKAFLMDEPLGALDAEFRELMCGELRRLHDRIGATTVYVTHDQLEAMAMGDRIAVMNAGEVLQVGPPQEVYDRPRDLFVAGFIGSPAMNFLPLESGAQPRGNRGVRGERHDRGAAPARRDCRRRWRARRAAGADPHRTAGPAARPRVRCRIHGSLPARDGGDGRRAPARQEFQHDTPRHRRERGSHTRRPARDPVPEGEPPRSAERPDGRGGTCLRSQSRV